MILLNDILKDVVVIKVIGSTHSITVDNLKIDSRAVQTGDAFIAVKGINTDGHKFIKTCIEKGARVIICESIPADIDQTITYVQVENSAKALGQLASNFYDRPSSLLKVIGVTGTNGKTSTVTLLYRLFRALGFKAGLLSTVENQVNDEVIPSTHTTPDAIHLNQLMKQMVDSNCEYCFMEVSSHAIDQYRVEGINFTGGIFTNITHDHLDYHKTFENYLKVKKCFFDEMPSAAFVLSNIDDRNGMVMLQNTKAHKYTYALRSPADFKAKIIDNNVRGLQLDMAGTEMFTRLIGEFNAYNILAVYACALLLGVDKLDCLTQLSALSPPDGRFDQIVSGKDNITGIVDYAHTPDALKNVLHTINAIRKGNETLICIIGCGGDRDAAKRPIMAQVAAHLSDKCILTSDNPRSEDPNEIIKQMNEGVTITDRKKVLSITDRKEAIRTACMMAGKDDIILLAGKGHEKYQEIKGIKYDFDDKTVLKEIFIELNK
jgi:UDP-N-acetylmuramoyl-L-alanyl-D-glutamate--2,6-diaminopimelate ligase